MRDSAMICPFIVCSCGFQVSARTIASVSDTYQQHVHFTRAKLGTALCTPTKDGLARWTLVEAARARLSTGQPIGH